eukprot:TRINITY_DN50380_c0_g1_i2.p1 TRINITY_DN50380_c0_g1~~TRINITY_DN50380_c0_g1_i2.p1  ORF type:complete len:265 (-),score=29.06 TRINITY_DN50380_c0_g1_i2:37-831(-)
MRPGQIYKGYAPLLHLLAVGFKEAVFQLVTANPLWTANILVKQYLKNASASCPQKFQGIGLEGPPVKPDSPKWIHRGSYFTAGLSSSSHLTMGLRKLGQLAKQAEISGSNRMVWLGDGGQGDVCAAVCFVAPERCTSSEVGYFYDELVRWSSWRLYKRALDFVQRGGEQDLERFALIHMIPDVNYDNEPGWKKLCVETARKIDRIGLFSRDPTTQDPSSDYGSLFDAGGDVRSAVNAAISIGAAPKMSQEQLESVGKLLRSDCQ